VNLIHLFGSRSRMASASFEHADLLLEGIEHELQQRIDMLLEVNENYRG
jgi:hypothetical protein